MPIIVKSPKHKWAYKGKLSRGAKMYKYKTCSRCKRYNGTKWKMCLSCRKKAR